VASTGGGTISGSTLIAPALSYPLLWLGIHLPFQRVGAHNDYSYVVYIYAFPVQQLLAMWQVQRWGYAAFVFLGVVGTVPFAVASWWLIEKRALKLKRLDLRVRLRSGATRSMGDL
jgi:peptidoglycan/LPS O-acetylase OafA/YrhL